MKTNTPLKQPNTALFDPITSELKPVDLKFLMGLLERSRSAVDGLKTRRAYVKELNVYVVPISITVKEKRELMAKVKIPAECWKRYALNSRYQVSNLGRVKVIDRWGKEMFVVPTCSKSGAKTNDISFMMQFPDGRRVKKRVGHFVMEVFSPKPNDGQEWVCAHRDLNIWNNRRSNLEWMERKTFNRWVGRKTTNIKPVIKYDIETGEELEEYRSISEASRDNFMSTTSIYCALKGVHPSGCGFGWKESDDYELKGA